MFLIKKESAWKFVTSSTGGIGVEFVAAEGGAIYLTDPSGGDQTFRYGSAGVGLSVGLKLPKVGKINLPKVRGKSVGGVAAPAAFPNTGQVYISASFPGDELTAKDIRGVCAFVEAGGGLVAGASATAMVFGMNPLWLAAFMATAASGPVGIVFSGQAGAKLINSATGLLLMAGVNAGLQAGGGGAAFIGGLM